MYSITKKWYVVYTRPKWEKKVADQLGRKKIEHYCPLNKVHKQWADRKKLVAEPLFSSYVFVCIDESEQLSVRLTDGIINFVYWLGKPAEVRNDEIQAIRDFLTDYHDVRLEKTRVNPNDIVRVIGGPLVTQKGYFTFAGVYDACGSGNKQCGNHQQGNRQLFQKAAMAVCIPVINGPMP